MAIYQFRLIILCLVLVVAGMWAKDDRPDSSMEVVAVIGGHDRMLQLHITWSDVYLERDEMWELYITTDNTSPSCPAVACNEHINGSEITEAFVPEKSSFIEEPQNCVFHPGCSYTIHMHSPFNSKIPVQFVVPDCVEHVCKCDSTFPDFVTSLDYDMDSSLINFAWNISSAKPWNFVLEYFSLKFFNTHVHGNGPSDATTYEPRLVLLNTVYDEFNVQNLTGTAQFEFEYSAISTPDRIKVEIVLIDDKHCQSPYHVQYFSVKANGDDEGLVESTSTFLIVFIAAMIILVIFATACMYLLATKKKIKHPNLVAKLCGWPISYDHISTNGCPTTQISIPLQESVIYIEKEIYDAKQQGLADHYEISPCSLKIGAEIGKGAFGRVFIALVHNIDGQGTTSTVAVKKLKKRSSDEEMEEFFNEIKTMKRVGYHPNIISLMGCCTIRQPLLMIMEYIGNGDLQHYLRAIRAKAGYTQTFEDNRQNALVQSSTDEENDFCSGTEDSDSDSDGSYILQREKLRPSVTETLYTTVSSNGSSSQRDPKLEYILDHNELQQFAIQIANGMRHLEELEITHRDLATRNILIDEQKRLKISDFGLSRTGVYVTTRNKKVPLRWLSIEAIRRNLYSSKSDVWAFGVVLWEIATMGSFPYPNVENHELLHYLVQGNRLQQPSNCSSKLYQLMRRCWHEDPLKRPCFQELLDELPEKKIYVDLDEMGDNDVFLDPEEGKQT